MGSPINLQDAGVLYHCQQSHGGEKLVNANAQIAPLTHGGFAPNQMVQLRTAGHDIVYKAGTRHAAFCSIALQGTEPSMRVKLRLQPTGVNFYMSGIGYGHPTWGHGARHAEPLVVQEDVIRLCDVDEMDPLYNHIQALCSVEIESKDDSGKTQVQVGGMTSLEQYVLGVHSQSGLQHNFDVPQSFDNNQVVVENTEATRGSGLVSKI